MPSFVEMARKKLMSQENRERHINKSVVNYITSGHQLTASVHCWAHSKRSQISSSAHDKTINLLSKCNRNNEVCEKYICVNGVKRD